MDIYEPLVDYIKEQLAKGRSRSAIALELSQAGWFRFVIDAHMRAATAGRGRKMDESKIKPVLQKAEGKFPAVVACLGAALLFTGIAYLTVSGWTSIAPGAKLLISVVLLLAVYAVAFYLKVARKAEKAGRAAFLFGTLIFGASVFTVAFGFSLRANWSDALLVWMLGGLLLGLALESYTHYYLCIALGVAAAIIEPVLVNARFFPGHNALLALSTLLFTACTGLAMFAALHIRARMPERQKAYYRAL